MTKSTIWSILGGIVAIIVAWWIVSALFSVLWFIVKLAVVAVVAVAVYAGIRSLTRRAGD
ncbi:hypothetical protein [Microbacterium sp.]|jgi:hypothetical protein|uniref:hypothetical protein n=1 Tax=Microbacterium sp. TaxID=51671 RepID=UPI00261BCF89|nr:hypothetical protein [uncultured Microbacterium sp.]